MLIIDVTKERNIDSALKKLRNKFKNTGMRQELMDRKEYTKKSSLKREQKRKAAYIERLKSNKEDI